MTLLVLTGATGVGKSTLQARLASDTGARVVTSVTTRSVEAGEIGVEGCSRQEFETGVMNQTLIAPISFAEAMYAWVAVEVRDLLNRPGVLGVATARPYTALLLSTMFRHCVAVRLTLDEQSLQERRCERSAARDVERGELRVAADDLDEVYGSLFRYQVRADEQALRTILQVVKQHEEP